MVATKLIAFFQILNGFNYISSFHMKYHFSLNLPFFSLLSHPYSLFYQFPSIFKLFRPHTGRLDSRSVGLDATDIDQDLRVDLSLERGVGDGGVIKGDVHRVLSRLVRQVSVVFALFLFVFALFLFVFTFFLLVFALFLFVLGLFMFVLAFFLFVFALFLLIYYSLI